MLAISGCAVTTAGVKKGDERNMARSINDVSAGRAISARMGRAHDFELSKVDVEVAEGIAVLTGSLPTEKDRQEAEKIAWSGPNILQVGNEIHIGDGKRNLIRGTKDSVLGTRIRTRLIAEKNVRARNVNIETYNGKVYLLGVARTTSELERMTYIASTTKGVKEVVSYVKLANQPVTSNASFRPAPSYAAPTLGAPARPGVDPSIPMLGAPQAGPQSAPQSVQRQLPDFLTTTPQPSAPGAGAAPAPNAPYFRDPVTGETIVLPPGTKTVPYNPNGSSSPSAPRVGNSPFYINPSNGQKVQIVWTGG